MAVKRGLNRGLSSMIPTTDSVMSSNIVHELKIMDVEPNKEQPRKHFDEEKLKALSESISEMGVILPIIVVKNDGGRYTIIAGERRWRASKKAGLKTIPAIVKDYEEKEACEVSLIENLQRENLNPIEEAKGYKSLIDGFSMTQEEISKRVGKSRSAITNSLRILNLPDEIIKMLINKELTEGHARAILSLNKDEDKISLAKKVVSLGMTVRQTEEFVRNKGSEKKKKKKPDAYTAEIKSLEDRLSKKISTKVKIKHGEKKGKIEIEYYGNEDLDRILKFFQ